MSDKEDIEELRALLGNGLDMVYGIYPQRLLSSSVQGENHALVYEKLNHLVQGMTELCGTVEELLALVRG
jgi:hypothetical protein